MNAAADIDEQPVPQPPIFEADPMLSLITGPLHSSPDPRDKAIGLMLEQQNKTSKEVTYQSAVLHDVTRDMRDQKRQSRENGTRLAVIEGYNLAAVVKDNATNTSIRRVLVWVGGPAILAGLAALGKHVVDTFFP